MRKAEGKDSNQIASEAVSSAVGLPPPTGVYEALLKRQAAKKAAANGKNPAAVALGRLGGLKGGKARAKALSPEERKAIARKAAKKRWQKAGQEKKANASDADRFLALKKQGLSMEQIGHKMGKSPAELAELVLRLVDVMARTHGETINSE